MPSPELPKNLQDLSNREGIDLIGDVRAGDPPHWLAGPSSSAGWMALQMPTASANSSWRRAHAQRVSRLTPTFAAYAPSVGF